MISQQYFLRVHLKTMNFFNEILDVYQTIWNNNSIPKKWGCSKLITIWKGPSKGSAEDPATYRGLQIGSTLCKVLIILIINRLKSWYEAQLLDQQQGFRKGRGCTDGLFQIKNIHDPDIHFSRCH